MRELYTNISMPSTLEELAAWVINATRVRTFDVSDYEEQRAINPSIFDVPSSSTDTMGTEKVGDVAADSGFLYIVIDNSGALEWRRVAISSF